MRRPCTVSSCSAKCSLRRSLRGGGHHHPAVLHHPLAAARSGAAGRATWVACWCTGRRHHWLLAGLSPLSTWRAELHERWPSAARAAAEATTTARGRRQGGQGKGKTQKARHDDFLQAGAAPPHSAAGQLQARRERRPRRRHRKPSSRFGRMRNRPWNLWQTCRVVAVVPSDPCGAAQRAPFTNRHRPRGV